MTPLGDAEFDAEMPPKVGMKGLMSKVAKSKAGEKSKRSVQNEMKKVGLHAKSPRPSLPPPTPAPSPTARYPDASEPLAATGGGLEVGGSNGVQTGEERVQSLLSGFRRPPPRSATAGCRAQDLAGGRGGQEGEERRECGWQEQEGLLLAL